MYRLTLHNLFYDGIVFLKRHKGKFVLAVLISIAGFALGVSGAITSYNVAVIGKFDSFSVILLISGKKTFISFFIGRLIQLLCLTLIMLLLSYRLIFAVFNYVIIFFFCFFSARNIAISVMIIKTGFLPVTILCLVPSVIIYCGIYCCICVISIDFSCDYGYYNQFNIFYGVIRLTPVCIPHFIFLFLLSLAETILVCILTLGLSV